MTIPATPTPNHPTRLRYMVRRHSDNATTVAALTKPGGIAAAAAQETFCGAAFCSVDVIFDQSPSGKC